MLKSQHVIYDKLEAFIKKYYTNELIKGSLFFIGLGLIYFLLTLFIEYFLWLKPSYRTFLFILFIIVEAFLFFRFILIPIFKLFKLKAGIDYKVASAIIGTHFSEVQDKLINFLQLSQDQSSVSSELVLASIEQKANTLSPIPFGNAINLKANSKYYPLALAPIVLVSLIYFSGNSAVISQSLNRVVNFNTAFQPPAPFQFVLVNPNLKVQEGRDFIIKLKTVGKIVPESTVIFIDEQSYFMESNKLGVFEFKIEKPTNDVLFHVEANGISSNDYVLNLVRVPAIASFEMALQFPSYLKRKGEIVKGTGNAMIPEGTLVTWRMKTIQTDVVKWVSEETESKFNKTNNNYSLSKIFKFSTDYQVVTSNSKIDNYEKLKYHLDVVQDQFPTIKVSAAPDSLKVSKDYVLGQVADDYGLSKLQIVYYIKGKPLTSKRGTITVKNDSFDQFVFAFPGNLPVQEGIAYEYYFEIFDNDAPHKYKSSKSDVFVNRVITAEEKQDLMFQEQSGSISGLQKSLKVQDAQISEMEKLQKLRKQKDNLDFKDQQRMEEFINRQLKQDEMMKDFTRKMKDNLQQSKADKKDNLKEELEKRLEKAEKEFEKNEKLLEELRDLNSKIQNEELQSKLDKVKQNSKNQVKNLEQLVELTKRYYVQKKAEQLQDKLNSLSDKLDKLAKDDVENKTESQEKINKDFDKIKEDLDGLKKENKELKNPISIPNDENGEKSIDDDLKKATDELKKGSNGKAAAKQKSAAKKMKEMSQKMDADMEAGESNQLDEDVAMLRQIVDNLLAFSVSQESLLDQFKKYKVGSPGYNKSIRIQQDLKQQFKHVDDSLFALSLRNPKFSDNITKEIGNVDYNVDNALVSFTDAQVAKGISHQQYSVAAANKLADFLSEILNGMQMQMSGSGQGKPKSGGGGDGFQLPDIIKKQEALGEKMKDGIKKGQVPGKAVGGDKGKDGKQGNGGSGSIGEGGEGNAQEVMDIYKEQRQLREALQNELNKQGLGGTGSNVLEQMKQLEKQLLNKGFKNEVLQKALFIKQEMLKLESASLQQGEDKKRQSESSNKQFNNRANALPSSLTEYLNSIEILNRQSLPLRSNFNQKVQLYFNKK